MNNIKLRLLFVTIYIVVDIIYVYLSKPVYDKTVISIQGAPMPIRLLSALSAWTCMALGWYFLTTSLVAKWKANGMSSIIAGLLAGLTTGFAIIGTFNFTSRAMFNNYDIPLMIRDMIWGVGWITTLTIIYSNYI